MQYPNNKKAPIAERFFVSILYSTPPKAGRQRRESFLLNLIFFINFIMVIKINKTNFVFTKLIDQNKRTDMQSTSVL